MNSDYPDEYDPDALEALPRAELTAIIDGLLCAHRPDRYEPGADWLDDVSQLVENKITMIEAKALAARVLVGQREGQATRRVNRFLKSLKGDDGFAVTPEWAEFADQPVAFVQTTGDEDKGHRVRVTLRAMRAHDWLQFALHGRADAQHRFDAEMAMYDAAEWLASQQGARPFAEWAQLSLPIGHSDVA